MSKRLEIVCDVDIEQTAESFHAYAVPDGIDIRPGDQVILHDPPSVAFGQHVVCRCRATVLRAGPLDRALIRLASILELTGLYEVGFDAKEAFA